MKKTVFGLGDFVTKFGGWAAHHKELAIIFKQEHEEGNKIVEVKREEEKLQQAAEENPERVFKKEVTLIDFDTYEEYKVIQYYLTLENQNYKEAEVEYYNVNATNVTQEVKVRFIFKLGYEDFILEYEYETGGAGAISFKDTLEYLEDNIANIANDRDVEFEDKGISQGSRDNYKIQVVDEDKLPKNYEISADELLNSLVAVEIFEHKRTIL